MTDKDMIHFFVPMQRIPSATHQMKKLVVGRDGKPHTYEPPAVKETRSLFMASFTKFRPEQPLMGPVALTTKERAVTHAMDSPAGVPGSPEPLRRNEAIDRRRL